jgi:hypothetical protein
MRILIVLALLVSVSVPCIADKIKRPKAGVYVIGNRAHFIETSDGLTTGLKDALRGGQFYAVEGRRRIFPKVKVQVLLGKVYTLSEKRSAVTLSGNRASYSKATKQKYKYSVAKIKVLDGKHEGKQGWIIYQVMKVANADGSKPARSYYKRYLKPIDE